jgi:hypothetical protein
MGRAAGRNVAKPGQEQVIKEMRTKRPGQLKVFVRTINKELEEIEHLILEATVMNAIKNQAKR